MEQNREEFDAPVQFAAAKRPIIEQRRTYSLKNALRFRAAFDHAIRTNEDVWIACKDCGLAQRTLINRACEAMLYLGNELIDSEDKGEFKTRDYLVLKAATKFGLGTREIAGVKEEGIFLRFKRRFKEGAAINYETVAIGVIKAGGKVSHLQENQAWKEKLIAWVESGDGVFYEPDLILSPENQAWIRDIFNKAGIEYKVTSSEIRAMK